MNPVFPTIGEYNRLFQKLGGGAFKTLHGIELIPSRTSPIKVFLFGSGAYAAVFKGRHEGKTYAIRCFLTAEGGTINRYRAICNHLEYIQEDWITDSEFLKDEIEIDYKTYPILKMEWVDGLLINEFIDQNLSDKNVLKELQSQLVAISNSLESNNIGHGDLQCGNIIVTGSSSNFQIRLIDYDGMYVPELSQMQSIELGRSEFQHPKRSKLDFNPEMDRFSFWVMLTALEAIKHDKTLWLEVMQGGFNTLDNFLFTIQDFIDPEQSKLFNRLYNLNSDSLNFYLNELKSLCKRDLASLTKPKLFGSESQNQTKTKDKVGKKTPPKRAVVIDKQVPNGMFKIISEDNDVTILTSTFHKLGSAPLELEKIAFEGKTVIVTNGSIVRQILLSPEKSLIKVYLGRTVENHDKKDENPTDSNKPLEEAAIASSSINKELEEEQLARKELILQKELLKKREEEASEKRRKEKEEEEKLVLEKNIQEKRKRRKEREKEEEKRKNWSYTLIAFLVAVFVIGLVVYTSINDPYSRNDNSLEVNAELHKEPVVSSIQVERYFDNVRDFLKAEESRDFEKISSFMSPNIKRYYDSQNPLIANLKRRYENVWSYTSNSKNTVYGIYKRDDYTYDLTTTFSYYDERKGKQFKIKSKVRFVFDKYGKILETYSLESEPIEEREEYESVENSIKHYDFVGSYYDGRALVRDNDKYGYIDEAGREVIPAQYYTGNNFNNGQAYVADDIGGKYIDIHGNEIIEQSDTEHVAVVNKASWAHRYSYVGPLSDGLILVMKNYKYGYVNAYGYTMIPLQFSDAADFKNGKAKVTYSGRVIFINKDGNVVSGF